MRDKYILIALLHISIVGFLYSQISYYSYDASGNQTARIHTGSVINMVWVSSDTIIEYGSTVVLKAGGGQEYLWSTGDTTAEVMIQPIQSNTYGVTVTDVCLVDRVDTVQIEVLHVNATEQANGFASVSMDIYPNPADAFINLRVHSNANLDYLLLLSDASGKVWYQNALTGNYSTLMETRHLPNGVYYIVLQATEQQLVRRFSISR